jgi:hypothetical protein
MATTVTITAVRELFGRCDGAIPGGIQPGGG